MGDPKRAMAATVLVFEAVVVLFAALVAKDLSGLTTAQAVGGGVALGALLVVAAGLLRAAWGYWLGSALQVAVVATGVVVPAMVVLGLVFTALWVVACVLGTRIERERAAWGATADPEAGPG